MTLPTKSKPSRPSYKSVDWIPFAQKLATVLERLEEDQFLILPVKRSNQYIQFSAQGGFGMRVETTSNGYLNKKKQLDEHQIATLVDAGWQEPTNLPKNASPEHDPDGSPNFFLQFPAPVSFKEVANLTVRTFSEILRVPHPGRLQYYAFGEHTGNIELPELGLKPEERTSKEPIKEIPQQLLDTIRETTGLNDIDFDKDGEIGVRYRSAFPMVCLTDNQRYVRIFSPILHGVEENKKLLSRLNEFNANPNEKIIRFFFNKDAIYGVADIIADPFVSTHISQAFGYFSEIADSMGTLLQAEFGGLTAFEVCSPSSLKH